MWQVTCVRLIQGDHWPVQHRAIHTTQTNPVIEGVRPTGYRDGVWGRTAEEWAWGRVSAKLCRNRWRPKGRLKVR
jgi:hypothetical protein